MIFSLIAFLAAGLIHCEFDVGMQYDYFYKADSKLVTVESDDKETNEQPLIFSCLATIICTSAKPDGHQFLLKLTGIHLTMKDSNGKVISDYANLQVDRNYSKPFSFTILRSGAIANVKAAKDEPEEILTVKTGIIGMFMSVSENEIHSPVETIDNQGLYMSHWQNKTSQNADTVELSRHFTDEDFIHFRDENVDDSSFSLRVMEKRKIKAGIVSEVTSENTLLIAGDQLINEKRKVALKYKNRQRMYNGVTVESNDVGLGDDEEEYEGTEIFQQTTATLKHLSTKPVSKHSSLNFKKLGSTSSSSVFASHDESSGEFASLGESNGDDESGESDRADRSQLRPVAHFIRDFYATRAESQKHRAASPFKLNFKKEKKSTSHPSSTESTESPESANITSPPHPHHSGSAHKSWRHESRNVRHYRHSDRIRTKKEWRVRETEGEMPKKGHARLLGQDGEGEAEGEAEAEEDKYQDIIWEEGTEWVWVRESCSGIWGKGCEDEEYGDSRGTMLFDDNSQETDWKNFAFEANYTDAYYFWNQKKNKTDPTDPKDPNNINNTRPNNTNKTVADGGSACGGTMVSVKKRAACMDAESKKEADEQRKADEAKENERKKFDWSKLCEDEESSGGCQDYDNCIGDFDGLSASETMMSKQMMIMQNRKRVNSTTPTQPKQRRIPALGPYPGDGGRPWMPDINTKKETTPHKSLKMLAGSLPPSSPHSPSSFIPSEFGKNLEQANEGFAGSKACIVGVESCINYEASWSSASSSWGFFTNVSVFAGSNGEDCKVFHCNFLVGAYGDVHALVIGREVNLINMFLEYGFIDGVRARNAISVELFILDPIRCRFKELWCRRFYLPVNFDPEPKFGVEHNYFFLIAGFIPLIMGFGVSAEFNFAIFVDVCIFNGSIGVGVEPRVSAQGYMSIAIGFGFWIFRIEAGLRLVAEISISLIPEIGIALSAWHMYLRAIFEISPLRAALEAYYRLFRFSGSITIWEFQFGGWEWILFELYFDLPEFTAERFKLGMAMMSDSNATTPGMGTVAEDTDSAVRAKVFDTVVT